jgi:hypothetical protein
MRVSRAAAHRDEVHRRVRVDRSLAAGWRRRSTGASAAQTAARYHFMEFCTSATRDALALRRQRPAAVQCAHDSRPRLSGLRAADREVVFFAIGLEITPPPTAVVVKQAQARGLRNFSVLGCHVLTPSAIASILESPEVRQWGRVPLKWIAPLLKIRQAPVGKLQAVDPTVVAFVVGDQDEILRQGMGSDLGIHVADRVAIDFLAGA